MRTSYLSGITSENRAKFPPSFPHITQFRPVPLCSIKCKKPTAQRLQRIPIPSYFVPFEKTGMTNRIEGGADLDGVISTLTDGFTEALLTAAEGVHA